MVDNNKIQSDIVEVRNNKKDKVNLNSIANSALGNMAANSLSYGIKKVFAPNSMPATKEDILALQKDINQIKLLLKMKTIN